MNGFVRHSIILFLALRAGDCVNLAAGWWFVPKYVSPEDLGAVLPVTNFATFLSLPLFALAMTVMKESSALSAAGERGRLKSLLRGVFIGVAVATVSALLAAGALMPRFLGLMRVSDASVGFLVISAALLGCVAPVYTDALQSLKRFPALAFAEVGGAAFRLLVMAVVMPFRALAGYFAGQTALPAFRVAASVVALGRDLAVPAVPFWERTAVRRMAFAFAGVLAYQAIPMGAALLEQSLLRTVLPEADSAGYYMATRFSDFLYYLTFPLMMVMFPYTATAAQKGETTRPYVVKCAAATLAGAAAMSAAYAFFGADLLGLLPNGGNYLAYAKYMPYLVLITALTTCQVFHTNAEVSAGRFGFLLWLAPLHIAYAVALYCAARHGLIGSLDSILAWFGAISLLRFLASGLQLRRCPKPFDP